MRDGEIFFWIIFGIFGFVVGGMIGAAFFTGFHPACWIGLAVCWGLPICIHCFD